MPVRIDVATAILLAGFASFACRIGGYVLMRYVAITPRIETWLKAIPIALIGAILGPVGVNGGPAEWLGLVTAVVTMKITGNELASAVAAMAAVAGVRALAA